MQQIHHWNNEVDSIMIVIKYLFELAFKVKVNMQQIWMVSFLMLFTDTKTWTVLELLNRLVP